MISEKEKFFDPRKPFASKRPETHEEWQARMGGEVLAVVRSGLYLDFRFLDMALSALTPVPDERCGVLATDGVNLYYQPSALLRLYQENPKYLNRLYLHTVFHCVFRHLWLKGKRDARLWNLACDIAVENVLDSLNRSSVKRPLTWVRQNAYAAIAAEGRVVAAAPAYRWLAGQTPGILRQLEREFYTDDHRLWPKDAPEQPQQMPTPLPQKTWQKIGERMQTELDLRDKEAGDGADALKQQVKAANRSRRSYQDFLRRFCVTREEVHLDPDEFDLNFYTYGLSVYGNMPLIEPLETRESKKIEELALVIDTSYSTSGELVRAFLAETYTLLKGRENFFHRMNLHLIQADNTIRQDLLIRNEDELIHAMNHFELRGGGGTDFRPAFEYVNQLCAEKKFSNLRGLLYFTDGMGTYPARRPAYDTAFLFLGEKFDDANVPPWAMKVVLDEAEKAETRFTAEGSAKIIDFMMSLDSGVIAMNMEVPGVAETSGNVGTIVTDNDTVTVRVCYRSGLNSKKEYTIEKSKRLARMAHAGFAVESSSSEWEYKSDSRLSALIQRIYLKRYGQPIKVEVSHGGNECGTFFKHFPDADIVCTGTQIIGPHTPNESVMVSIIQKEWEMLQLELKGMLEY